MINFDMVIDVNVETRTFFLHKGYGEENIGPCDRTELNIDQFNKHLFLYRKAIKERPDPQDRVELFECDVNGVYSLDKHDRIIKSRLRPGETFERDIIPKRQANLPKQMHEGNLQNQKRW